MGLRNAIRRAAAGSYEAPSSRTHCEACGREYTKNDPMVHARATAPGEITQARIHRSHLSDLRSRYYEGPRPA
ncbi:hypothetical protein BBK14_07915 [Parafrankia soli]|uniref:C2H2-type domain-containing protein n=1 Tax=Parafrankia soli TaxID=2599596 RepID=A0A1S1PIS3_9ACTN|nr:hypothetical protein [Parafrankia soli]OHV21196.1 hypothetical protein BBK14_07915 [Parafrankia soli]